MSHLLPATVFAASIFLLAGCASTTRLERSLPENEGVAPAAVAAFVSQIEDAFQNTGDYGLGNVNSFLLMKNGKVIAEGAWSPYRVDAPRQLFSLSKSVAATAIGIAVREKLLSIDDAVIGFFPDQLPETVSENLSRMKVRDLLTMQSGHKDDALEAMFESDDIAAAFLACEVEYEPGTVYLYENGATYMLSAIITRLTGESLLEYLEPRLFVPLGITGMAWDADADGVNYGAWGLWLTMEEVGKFGQLYANRGVWDGERILDEEWIDQAKARHSEPWRPEPDWHSGYGFQFWRCINDAYRGDGFLGQIVVVMERENAVLVLFGASDFEYKMIDAMWDTLYPAFHGRFPAQRAMTQKELDERLAGLALEYPETAQAPAFPAGTRAVIELPEENVLGTKQLEFDFESGFCRIGDGSSSLRCGYGEWLENPALTPLHDDEEDTFPIQGPLFGRAFRLGPDEVMCVVVSPNSAIQLYLGVKLSDGTAKIRTRFNWDRDLTEYELPAAIIR